MLVWWSCGLQLLHDTWKTHASPSLALPPSSFCNCVVFAGSAFPDEIRPNYEARTRTKYGKISAPRLSGIPVSPWKKVKPLQLKQPPDYVLDTVAVLRKRNITGLKRLIGNFRTFGFTLRCRHFQGDISTSLTVNHSRTSARARQSREERKKWTSTKFEDNSSGLPLPSANYTCSISAFVWCMRTWGSGWFCRSTPCSVASCALVAICVNDSCYVSCMIRYTMRLEARASACTSEISYRYRQTGIISTFFYVVFRRFLGTIIFRKWYDLGRTSRTACYAPAESGPAEPVGQVGPLPDQFSGKGWKAKRSKTDEKIWGQPESRRSVEIAYMSWMSRA